MNILVLTKAAFPFGSAYSTRMRAVVDALLEHGHAVTIVCAFSNDSANSKQYLRSRNKLTRVVFKQSKNGLLGKLKRAAEYAKFVEKAVCDQRFDAVICSSMYDRIGKVLRVLKNRSLPVLIESCEWFQAESWKGGIVNPHYLAFWRAWNGDFLKADGYIVISTTLRDHYLQTGKPVFLMPTVLDVGNTDFCKNADNGERISLLFAGTFGGGKDSVDPFIAAIDSDCRLGSKLRLVLAGPSKEELLETTKFKDEALRLIESGSIVALGRVPQSEIEGLYRKSDFGCFSRPNRRSSNAGFSTKLGEGMSVGTPFIVNNTGDISLYVENGISGFVIESIDIENVKKLLISILDSSQEERELMRREARKAAERYFDYRVYSEDLVGFIREISFRRKRNV